MEHHHERPKKEEVVEFLDVAELFVELFKQRTHRIELLLDYENNYAIQLDTNKSQISIYENAELIGKHGGSASARAPKGVIGLCWKKVEEGLQELKRYIKENVSCERRRIPIDLPSGSRGYIIQNTDKLFEKLRAVNVKGSQVGPVGANKVLFAVLPEIALPVDNQEWKHVFDTDKYSVILSRMVDEIEEWEKNVGEKLDRASPYAKTTLPAIYNIMAMSARPLR